MEYNLTPNTTMAEREYLPIERLREYVNSGTALGLSGRANGTTVEIIDLPREGVSGYATIRVTTASGRRSREDTYIGATGVSAFYLLTSSGSNIEEVVQSVALDIAQKALLSGSPVTLDECKVTARQMIRKATIKFAASQTSADESAAPFLQVINNKINNGDYGCRRESVRELMTSVIQLVLRDNTITLTTNQIKVPYLVAFRRRAKGNVEVAQSKDGIKVFNPTKEFHILTPKELDDALGVTPLVTAPAVTNGTTDTLTPAQATA